MNGDDKRQPLPETEAKELEALSELMEALGGLFVAVSKVTRGESPQSGAVAWYASGDKTLLEKFAGYSLGREQCLAIHAAMKKVFSA